MCDSLCSLLADRTLFAKNSDRPPDEAQVLEAYPARPGGGSLATTYLRLEDPGAASVVGSRPTWQWGLEHGVNQFGVAIGNEQLWTVDDPAAEPDGLTGLDLVRLGLERGRTAADATEVLVDLLARWGQGGIADRHAGKAYFSSFLITDADEAWILETSARSWAARRVARPATGAALSNRISLSTDWTRASADVAEAGDFDRWRRASSPTAHADRRLAVTRARVGDGYAPAPGDDRPGAPTPRELAGVLRDHGRAVGPHPGLPPAVIDRQGTGVSVCLHLTGVQATTAAMIVALPRRVAPDDPIRAWVALGSPCASLFVPLFPFDPEPAGAPPGPLIAPAAAPPALGDAATWARFAALRQRLETTRAADPGRADELLVEWSGRWSGLELELWAEADALAGTDPGRRARWAPTVWPRVEAVLAELGT